MIIYKTIETIEECERILRERYNVDSFGPRPDSDEEYLSYLKKEIMKFEDEAIFSSLKKL